MGGGDTEGQRETEGERILAQWKVDGVKYAVGPKWSS